MQTLLMLGRASGRCGRLLLFTALVIPVVIIWSFWYAMNSDRDDIAPLLTQLIPAGNAMCRTSTVFECASCLEPHLAYENATEESLWQFEYGRDDRNEGLRDEQCEAAFPGLYEDIHRGVNYWKYTEPVTASRLDRIPLQEGMTRALLYQGKLYVVATKSPTEYSRRKMLAVLSAMNRALSAAQSRETIPDIEFIFSSEDMAADVTSTKTIPMWVLARKATEPAMFLLPDFGFWAWDNIIDGSYDSIGPYDEVVDKALELEYALPFGQKEPQLVWRGKLSFAPKLRRPLLDVSRDAAWNNVKELMWDVGDNYMTMEEHCKYKYIAHVEGRSYSASLKYRQACRSVIVMHKLQYIQHHHYLLVNEGPLQNFVEVERDYSDLVAKMDELMNDPAKAERIADNSVRTFRERYLTPAAEACYWRALWRGYSQISEPAQLWTTGPGLTTKRGLRYETFVLLSSEEMLDFIAR